MKKILLILSFVTLPVYAQSDSTISLFKNTNNIVDTNTKKVDSVVIDSVIKTETKTTAIDSLKKSIIDSVQPNNRKKVTINNSNVKDTNIKDTIVKSKSDLHLVDTTSQKSKKTNIGKVERIEKNISFIALLKDNSDPAVVKYKKAIKLNNKRKFRDALPIFKFLLINFPEHPLAGNFQYWIGELQYKLGKYDSAIEALRNLSLYPNSPKADDAQFLLVKCYRKMKLKNQAIAELETFFYKFPDSEYYSRAKKIYNNLKR